MRPVAWLCLGLQCFSAGSVFFLPSSLAAATVSTAPPLTPEDLAGLPVQPYVLRKGETPASVAASSGLTLAQLERVNAFRTFRVPFARLTAGDEIDVPSGAALKTLSAQATGKATAPDGLRQRQTSDERMLRLAQNAQTLGGLLENPQTSGAAAGMVSSMASGAANDAVQKWLGQYGTVRAGLSLDQSSSLANSSLDWLVPLYDTPQNTLFTQLGARNKDGRNTVNLGWGVRWMAGDWMYGFNNFFDNDVTGNNRRVGLGVEARTNYLQFASNTYLRLNNWHQSRDFSDYDERPANGFDVRAQGWLPVWPQVGGKLVYEQYYGNEVALFGKDTRQSNPYAVTAGLNWTPFPLLTVGLEERLGKGGQNETNASLQLTWRPGESLSSQLSADGVKASRLVAASRYDLVDRNNNIVLEYRKQDLVSLALSTQNITGPTGTTHLLSATVRSKYGAQALNIVADSFVAAGGVVTPQDATHVSLTLPPYRIAQQAQAVKKAVSPAASGTDLNTYTLTVTAEDTKGNVSPSQTVVVTVLPPVLSIDGALQVSNDNVPANGTSAVTVAALIGDNNGHAVADQQVSFTTTYADGSTDTQNVVTDARGRAAADITSRVPGAATVTVTAGTVSRSTRVRFANTLSTPVVANSSLTVSPASIVADGSAFTTVTLTLKDTNSNGVKGQTVAFTATGTAVTLSGVTDNDDGTYTATL
ncbi:inverse autotransporter beta domain-containing protein, partial [Enterobacteriaceae bacterium C34B]